MQKKVTRFMTFSLEQHSKSEKNIIHLCKEDTPANFSSQKAKGLYESL